MINVLSWNIRQGGGTRITKLINVIKTVNPSILVFSEFRNNESGYKIRTALLSIGYRYQLVSAAPSNENSVIIGSKFPFNSKLFPKSDPKFYHNIVKAEFGAFSVYGMYLPHKKKHSLFELLKDKVKNDPVPMILCGDFNTGINYVDQKGNSFWFTDDIDYLLNNGCIDAFRHINGDVKEFSWYSHQGNGYRYDHTFIHRDILPLVSECHYLHEYRELGLSDHSPMLLALN